MIIFQVNLCRRYIFVGKKVFFWENSKEKRRIALSLSLVHLFGKMENLNKQEEKGKNDPKEREKERVIYEFIEVIYFSKTNP